MISLDLLATELLAGCRAYTRRNLYHAWARATGRGRDASFERFCRGPLARRLHRGPLSGLLPPARRWDGTRLSREWAAYFPRAVLLVDSHDVLDLFVASGVTVTGKLAVVCLDGSPAHVVEWLRAGYEAGHRAPVGYLHDAATVTYPFVVEPLATLVRITESTLDYCDMGLGALGMRAASFPHASSLPPDEIVLELEQLPPCALVAWAARTLLAKLPGDPRMAPLAQYGDTP